MSRSAFKFFVILLFAALALYSCVLVPAYQYIVSDLVLMDTLWFDVVDLLLQWMEIFGTAVLFAFVVFAVYYPEPLGLKKLLLLLGGALLFKYAAAIIAISIVYGTIDFTYNYSGYVAAFLIEAGLCTLILLLCRKYIKKHRETNRATQNAANMLGIAAELEPPLLPFASLFDRKNPLQRTVMLSVGIFTLLRLASYILSDIAFSMAGALFTAADIPVMLVYWLILILIPCFLAYLLICLMLRFAERRLQSKN
ncbi:MAG: hypothetical protein J6L87_05950 [Clostridia bacterium]|nr:hypothetical protein [Clostridia bacterium]